MSDIILGAVMLYCGLGNSNKQYFIEVYKEMADPGSPRLFRAKYGPANNLRAEKVYGAYTRSAVQKLIEQKTAKGYEITHVNGKPFTSGLTSDALRLLVNSNDWNTASTAQPEQKLKSRDVVVTFDAGQFAPIW